MLVGRGLWIIRGRHQTACGRQRKNKNKKYEVYFYLRYSSLAFIIAPPTTLLWQQKPTKPSSMKERGQFNSIVLIFLYSAFL